MNENVELDARRAEPAPSSVRLERVGAIAMVVWAAGTLGFEGVAQAGATAVLLMALVASRRIRLAPDLRLFAALTLAYACWQALSPFVALASGTVAHLPRGSRWSQALDTLAPLALAAIATFGVPWRALGWTLGVGWLLETALGLFQALVEWPWASWGPIRFPLYRLRENFGAVGGATRRAGLGLFFHRLRYANGAVAMLGPSAALLLMSPTWKRRAGALVMSSALLGCALMSFARTALAAAFASVLFALAILLAGRRRLLAGSAAALALGLLALSPTWRQRADLALQSANGGERADAWRFGWQIAKAHPALGVGFANYEQVVRPALRADQSEVLSTSAHNVALTVWAELGLPGLLLYLAQQLALALALWRRLRKGSVLAAGGLVSLVGFHVIGLAHLPQYHSGVALTFALVWGLALAPGAPSLQSLQAMPSRDGSRK